MTGLANSLNRHSGQSGGLGVLLLYWDYELQRGADRSTRGSRDWGVEDYRQTSRLLDLLDKYQMKATFAVIGFAASDGNLPYHAPEQIREIAQRGHEVASHSWEHEWIPSLSYDEFKSVLARSRRQLETVTGRDVRSFAPPWDAPYDYPKRGAFSVRQHLRSRRNFIDIPTMCRALRETGYATTRISYEAIHRKLVRYLTRRDANNQPSESECIEDMICFKTNAVGFDWPSLNVVAKAADEGGFAVIYAHPHSLIADNSQSIEYLVPFLKTVDALRGEGKLIVTTPSEVFTGTQRQNSTKSQSTASDS